MPSIGTKVAIKCSKGLKDGHKLFNKPKSKKDILKRYRLSRKEYGDIIRFIHERIVEKIVLENMIFRMPKLRAHVQMKKCKPLYVKDPITGDILSVKNHIDWKKTKALWEKYPHLYKVSYVYFLNSHTDGHYFTVRFYTRYTSTRNLKMFAFKTHKDTRQRINKMILNPLNTNKLKYYGHK